MLESQVKEAKQMVEESDIKYDEVARKLAMVSAEITFHMYKLELLIDHSQGQIISKMHISEAHYLHITRGLIEQIHYSPASI